MNLNETKVALVKMQIILYTSHENVPLMMQLSL